MNTYHRSAIMLPFLSIILLLSSLLSACAGNGSTATNVTSTPAPTLKDISIGLGYIPDIQFAPFYVAQSKGYYKTSGLNVTFHHGIVPDLFGSMIAGKNDFVFAGGDEELAALDKNKSLKIIDIATIFQKYPVSLIVPANSSIKTLADLKGRVVGVPGPFGSTYTGLLALLYKANLSQSAVKIQSIGFTQVAALLGNKVDAVMGYSNNEPLQLQKRGFNVRTFAVSDYQPLVSNGIITTSNTYQNNSKMVRDFVQATLKGLKDVIADPAGAVEISKTYVPGLITDQAMSILQATIPLWQGNGQVGYNDSAIWIATEQFLVKQKLISPVQDLSQLYTNQTVV
jgi:NitT/TauT family transport system substrate-binding protein